MKTTKHILIGIMALLICFVLIGCGKATQDIATPTATPAAEPTPTAKATPAAAQEVEAPTEKTADQQAGPEAAPVEESAAPASAPASVEDTLSFLGTWKPYSQEGSIAISHEQLVEMGYADQMSLTMNADGSVSVYLFGSTSQESWTDNGDGNGTVTISGETYPMKLENGMLAMDMGTYVAWYENGEHPIGGVPIAAPKASDDHAIPLPAKADAPALPYTLPNGLTIDELSVVLAGGRMWSFGYALENPTGSLQTFDPSKFELRNSDGIAVSTYASFVSADEVKPGVPLRTSINIGMKDALNLGDEIYFFYDGIFLGTAVAREF